MTKTEFIDNLAQKHNFTRSEAERILNAFLDSVEDALSNEGRLLIKGFGVFDIVQRNERKARNPRTGESVIVPAAKAVRFRSGKALQELI